MNDPIPKNETGVMQTFSSPVWLNVSPFLFFFGLFVLFFSPVIFSDLLLAPLDGFRYGLPNLYSERTLWTNLLFSGFPIAADPQAQTWYPLAFLFSLFADSWKAYIISAYVLSACFMFGYVWTVTQSRMAGLVAGIGFGMSGFMIGRLGQAPLIHTAAWVPLIFWVIEKIRQKPSAGWTVIGSLAIACSFLGGHPQIIFYGMIVAGAYVVYMGWHLESRRWGYFGNFAFMVLISMGLVGVQLLPTMELAEWSSRSELSYKDFISFSLTPMEIPTLLFTYLLGGGGTIYDVKYFGDNTGMEWPGYLGLLTLLLACLAVVSFRSNRIVRFWLVTALITFVMALGKYTPLGQLMFYLPGFNSFRAPVRHFLEITLAGTVLAGLEADYIQQRKISTKQMKGVVLGAVGIFGLTLIMIWVFPDTFEQMAIKKSVKSLDVISWKNAAIWVPVLVMTFGVSSLALFRTNGARNSSS